MRRNRLGLFRVGCLESVRIVTLCCATSGTCLEAVGLANPTSAVARSCLKALRLRSALALLRCFARSHLLAVNVLRDGLHLMLGTADGT